jgi:hypothetical protein
MEHAKVIYARKRTYEKVDEIDKVRLGGNAIKRLVSMEKY